MKPAKLEPKRSMATFDEQYAARLRQFVQGGGEGGLAQAYELGHKAIGKGKSLIEITTVHHRVLSELLLRGGPKEKQDQLINAAAEFLAESLSHYEMAHRGFREAVQALRQLNEMLEEEIKHIAHAVHDEAGQLLVTVHLALAELGEGLPEQDQEKVRKVDALLKQVGDQLRRYSHELRPSVLDDLGWTQAIRFLAEGISKRTGIPIRVETTLRKRLPAPAETALYRIAQEALTNAVKHAKATRIRIRIRQEKGRIFCCIADNGIGFDLQSLQSHHKPRGLGMIGMRERLDAIGGTLSVESAPGKGTRLSIQLPMEAVNDNSHCSRG